MKGTLQKLNVAVDLGGTRVRVALADAELRLRHALYESTNHRRAAAGIVDQIVDMGNRSLKSEGLTWTDVGRIAVASPGPLDPATGVVYAPPNMPGWGEVPLGGDLQRATGVPVTVVNDANAAGLGELRAGAGRGHRHLVYLTISTGIGGGVVVDGAMLEGSTGVAGEIGHMTVDYHGAPCDCGSVGCLEAIASGTSIGRTFRRGLQAGESSVVTEWTTPEGATAEDVARAAAAGDPFALTVWNDAMRALGFGIVNCIHIFNPEVVVLGGGVTKAGRLMFDIVERIVGQHTMEAHGAHVRVLPAELGEDAGLVGAAAVSWMQEQ